MSSLVVASLICLAQAQVYVTEGVSFNPTAAASAAPSATSLVIHMPLVPLNPLSNSQDWGANVTKLNDEGLPDARRAVYPISISNRTSLPGFQSHSWGDILEYTGAEIAEPDAAYPVIPNSGETLILGANSVLNISHAIDALPDNQTLIVPFGLNLGYEGKCNGSLIFGGKASYDANRVQSGQWYTLPGSEYGTFLKGGAVNLAYNATVQKFTAGSDTTPDGKSRSYHTRLNFNSEDIILPQDFDACGSNFCHATCESCQQ